MCGRFALYTDPIALAKKFQAVNVPEWLPSYNVAPSQAIPIIRQEQGRRAFAMTRWGLIPSWAKEINTGYSTINARAETVAEKPAFRSAFQYRRCLIPADGYFEWQEIANSKIKQPWYISLKNQEPMALAGLWEHWRGRDGSEIGSCTIIVTSGNELMQSIHDRMPVILSPETWDTWLDTTNTNKQGLQTLFTQYPADEMTAWPVSTVVNSPRHNSEECISRIANGG
ncbi:SOS response-associated peptidase [Methyloglobulus sp.]|uniref:SOS response-associated peptidase n=1 Tax=Methyloglobulus sp. TaxID=2518622 RepID=UPI00398983FE